MSLISYHTTPRFLPFAFFSQFLFTPGGHQQWKYFGSGRSRRFFPVAPVNRRSISHGDFFSLLFIRFYTIHSAINQLVRLRCLQANSVILKRAVNCFVCLFPTLLFDRFIHKLIKVKKSDEKINKEVINKEVRGFNWLVPVKPAALFFYLRILGFPEICFGTLWKKL